jgi:hypothetical protein
VKVVMANKKIEKVSFLPGMIQIDARPKILSWRDEDFNEVVNYVKDITEKAGLNATCKVEGDEIVVSAS